MKRTTGSTKRIMMMIAGYAVLIGLTACGGPQADGDPSAGSEQKLVIGMSAANLPVPDTSPTEGLEGFRFVGYQIYDPLVKWDLTKGDQPSALEPGLAESWDTPKDDPKVWTFHLRQNVKFHDGTPLNADAVLFAFDRILNTKSPYYNANIAGSSVSYSKNIESYDKKDDYTFTITTKQPYSFLLYDLSSILIGSPEAIKKSGADYANHPVGTGPFTFSSMKLGQEMVLQKNDSYWGGTPKLDKVILRPISEPAARLAAIQSGEVDWAEIPPTESIEQLKASKFQVLTNTYPHIWPYILNTKEGPWSNKKVRQAANYAIDREGMSVSLLNGAATPATQFMYEGHPWFNDKAAKYTYDPAKAKQLLAEAGFPNGFPTTFMVPSSGSGNMWPIQMNEYVQKNLKAVGIDVKLETVEWQSLLTQFLQGFPKDKQVGAYNISVPTNSPTYFSFFQTSYMFPAGLNVSMYSNPSVDQLLDRASATFDTEQQNAAIRDAEGLIADDAPWIYVVHDLNLRVLSPKVQGFVQPQSWFADLTGISIK